LELTMRPWAGSKTKMPAWIPSRTVDRNIWCSWSRHSTWRRSSTWAESSELARASSRVRAATLLSSSP